MVALAQFDAARRSLLEALRLDRIALTVQERSPDQKWFTVRPTAPARRPMACSAPGDKLHRNVVQRPVVRHRILEHRGGRGGSPAAGRGFPA